MSEERKCAKCKGKFTAKRYWQRFCSKECRDKYHIHAKSKALKKYRESHPEYAGFESPGGDTEEANGEV